MKAWGTTCSGMALVRRSPAQGECNTWRENGQVRIISVMSANDVNRSDTPRQFTRVGVAKTTPGSAICGRRGPSFRRLRPGLPPGAGSPPYYSQFRSATHFSVYTRQGATSVGVAGCLCIHSMNTGIFACIQVAGSAYTHAYTGVCVRVFSRETPRQTEPLFTRNATRNAGFSTTLQFNDLRLQELSARETAGETKGHFE